MQLAEVCVRLGEAKDINKVGYSDTCMATSVVQNSITCVLLSHGLQIETNRYLLVDNGSIVSHHPCLYLPTQPEKGSPVNPGKQAQSNGPLVELPLMHRAENPHGLKLHGSAWKRKGISCNL